MQAPNRRNNNSVNWCKLMSIHLKRCLCKPLVKANSPQYMSSILFLPRWGGNRRGEKEQVGEPMLLSSWVVCQLGERLEGVGVPTDSSFSLVVVVVKWPRQLASLNVTVWANESNSTTCNSWKPRFSPKGDYMASKLMSRPARWCRWCNEVSKRTSIFDEVWCRPEERPPAIEEVCTWASKEYQGVLMEPPICYEWVESWN